MACANVDREESGARKGGRRGMRLSARDGKKWLEGKWERDEAGRERRGARGGGDGSGAYEGQREGHALRFGGKRERGGGCWG